LKDVLEILIVSLLSVVPHLIANKRHYPLGIELGSRSPIYSPRGIYRAVGVFAVPRIAVFLAKSKGAATERLEAIRGHANLRRV